MKNSLILILIPLLFTGCTNKNLEPIEEAQYMENQEIVMEEYFDPVSLEGKFQSFMNESGQFIIYSRTNDKKHIFYIDGLPLEAQSKLKKQEIKSLTYLDDGILLSKNSFFGVKRNVDEQLIQDIEKIADPNFENQDVKAIGHIWFKQGFASYEEINSEKLKSFNNIQDFMAQGAQKRVN